MPIVGERQTRKPGASGYSIDTMAATAKQFGDMVKGILEDTRLELYTEPTKALRNPIVEQTMKSYFLENIISLIRVLFRSSLRLLRSSLSPWRPAG